MELLNDFGNLLIALGIVAVGAVVIFVVFLVPLLGLERLERWAAREWEQ